MKNTIKDIRFFTAGKALFTVGNDKCEHYTFKVRRGKDKFANFFGISILTGPDNKSSYTYMGMYNSSTLSAKPTHKSTMTADAKPFKVFNWAVKQISERKELPMGYTIQHEGKCCRCGRTLTTPDSVELGIGPECIKRFQ